MHIPDIQGWMLAAGIAIAVPILLRYLKARAKDFPERVLDYAVNEFRAYIKDRTDEPTKRLFRRWAQATFEWAEAEMDDVPGVVRMDAVMRKLRGLPVVGPVIGRNEDEVRELLEIEWVAWDQELKRRAQAGPS